jgi:hypothetical protein
MAFDRALVYIHHRKIIVDPPRLSYKKDLHGGMLLKKVDPAAVAKVCTIFFAPVYEELSRLSSKTV